MNKSYYYEYHLVPEYSMKMRMYPNKTQTEILEKAFHGVHVAKNMLRYKMTNNFKYTKEKVDKKTGDTLHWPDFDKAFAKESLDALRKENDCVSYTPSNALSGRKSGLYADFKKSHKNASLNKSRGNPVEKWDFYCRKEDGTKQHLGPRKYTKSNPRTSYRYTASNQIFRFTKDKKSKDEASSNSLWFDTGSREHPNKGIKLRGWNKKIRFDEDLQIDFRKWLDTTKENILVTVKRDKERHYVIILLKNVYVPVRKNISQEDTVAIDLGEAYLGSLSDGSRIESINKTLMEYSETIDILNNNLSKKYGYKNPQFKKDRKNDYSIQPSKNYSKLQSRYRHCWDKYNDFKKTSYETYAADIRAKYKTLVAEDLDVAGMFWRKEGEDDLTNDSQEQD